MRSKKMGRHPSEPQLMGTAGALHACLTRR